ncbi:hypothetical protein Trco_000972 [Trichoderma cornu-damae]|uniref:Apurinic-apyrimidinic endonuclease 1 n=1 Tax=Trichoderma cornu-damae TaxID=654480 RepID=A0A9P8QY34_9HYPO|nr:hypothetical protein Trco_000972 [Trichoderma cornu-damae]
MPRPSRSSQRVVKREEDEKDGATASKGSKATQSVSAAKRKAEEPEPDSDYKSQASKAVKKRKAQGKGDEEAMVSAERTAVSCLGRAMYIGAHVSAAGGVQNAVSNAVQIGANSFALFLKSQRKWNNPPITADAKNGFISQCKEHHYRANDHVLPHGSYLVNLAQADKDKARQAYDSFVDDLGRCEQLGIKLYNFHPGSTGGDAKAAAIKRIAAQLNKAHKATKTVVTVLENMAGSGNVVGSTWEDLRDIIALVDDKTRVGVCIDTCHAFAAGYDLRTPEAFKKTVDSFNEIVGAKYLKAFHLNDSKAPFNSNRDLHANIGTGFLGLRAFHSLVNHEEFQNKPMVLETPIDRKGADGKTVEDKQVWADEIKLLESLIDMDPDTKEFAELERELQAKGADERKKIQDQVDKKSKSASKKGKATSKKAKKEATSDDESE